MKQSPPLYLKNHQTCNPSKGNDLVASGSGIHTEGYADSGVRRIACKKQNVKRGDWVKGEPTARVFARILDCGREWVRLWLAIRALDTTGRGVLAFRVKELADKLHTSSANIYAWLSQGNLLGWRAKHRADGITTVFYNGIARLCRNLGVSDLGAVGDIPLRWLGDRSLCKAVSTQMDAQRLQRQAYFAARNSRKGIHKQAVAKPWAKLDKLSDSSSSEYSPGALEQGKGDRSAYLFVGNGRSLPGASHRGIASHSGWSPQTIQRRLDNRQRTAMGLFPVQKRRAVEIIEDPILKFAVSSNGGFLNQPTIRGVEVYKTFPTLNGKRFVGQLRTNIYQEVFPLQSAKRLRGKIKSAEGMS